MYGLWHNQGVMLQYGALPTNYPDPDSDGNPSVFEQMLNSTILYGIAYVLVVFYLVVTAGNCTTGAVCETAV